MRLPEGGVAISAAPELAAVRSGRNRSQPLLITVSSASTRAIRARSGATCMPMPPFAPFGALSECIVQCCVALTSGVLAMLLT